MNAPAINPNMARGGMGAAGGMGMMGMGGMMGGMGGMGGMGNMAAGMGMGGEQSISLSGDRKELMVSGYGGQGMGMNRVSIIHNPHEAMLMPCSHRKLVDQFLQLLAVRRRCVVQVPRAERHRRAGLPVLGQRAGLAHRDTRLKGRQGRGLISGGRDAYDYHMIVCMYDRVT